MAKRQPKPPKPETDTLARVSIEGTEFRVTPEGQPGAPPLVKAPTATADRSVESWVARVTAAIGTKPDTANYLGRSCGDGYYLLATDGHRALCQHGEATRPNPEGGKALTMAHAPKQAVWFDATPALTIALKRMRAAVSSKAKARLTTLTISRSRKRVILSTVDPTDGTQAQEWCPVLGQLQPVSVSVNTDYLLQALGCPGLRVYINPQAGEPIILQTIGGAYRFVVMPFGDKGVKPIAALDRPAVAVVQNRPVRSARAVAKRPSAASPATEVPAVSVTAAPQTGEATLTAGQKAWRTRQARIAAGAKPTDWVSAGRKAWETRMRNKVAA